MPEAEESISKCENSPRQENPEVVSDIGEVALTPRELRFIERQLDLNGHRYDASKGADPIDDTILAAKDKLLKEIGNNKK